MQSLSFLIKRSEFSTQFKFKPEQKEKVNLIRVWILNNNAQISWISWRSRFKNSVKINFLWRRYFRVWEACWLFYWSKSIKVVWKRMKHHLKFFLVLIIVSSIELNFTKTDSLQHLSISDKSQIHIFKILQIFLNRRQFLLLFKVYKQGKLKVHLKSQ